MALSDPTDDFDITICSICQGESNTPKCLPCLHTFCETCLNTYITSALEQSTTSTPIEFNCPVCRDPVEPPQPTTPYQKWAEQFPLNSFVLSLINQKKLNTKVKLCDPCKCDDIDVTAVFWCFNCSEAFCDACVRAHKWSNLTRSHDLKNINDINSTQLIASAQSCENHKNKLIEAFCHDHDQPCCTNCIATHHRQCTHVTTLEDAASGVIQSSDFVGLLQRLSDTSTLNQGLVNEKRENIQTLEKQKCDIQQKLQEMRQRMINHFDNLQSQFMKDFTRVHDQRVREFSKAIEEVNNRNEVILNCTRVIKTCKTRASETRAFLEMKKVLRKEKEQLKELDKILASHRRLEYLLELDSDMEKAMTGYESVGTVNVAEKHMPIKISSFSIKDKCGVDSEVHSGIILQDSTLLLPLYDAKILARFTNNAGLIKQSDVLPGKVWDVTTTDSHTAVVTRPHEKAIDFVDIERLTVNKTVSLNEYCYAITSSDNKLYIGCDGKLLVLDKDGNEVNTLCPYIGTGRINGVTVINSKEKKLVYTKHKIKGGSCHFVRVSDLKELHLFIPNIYSWNPRGVTSDRKGNVYIADFQGNVLHVSSDGILMRTLKTGLSCLDLIQFDDINNRLFVSESTTSEIYIYKMIKS